jgi:hypothetical protein
MSLPIRPQLRGTRPALRLNLATVTDYTKSPSKRVKWSCANLTYSGFLLAELAAVAVFVQSCPQGASATAQSTAPQIKAETRVVLVDVVVTGAKGDPVLNLKKDEFRIAEDCRMVIVFVSMMNSMTSLPAEFITAIEIVCW